MSLTDMYPDDLPDPNAEQSDADKVTVMQAEQTAERVAFRNQTPEGREPYKADVVPPVKSDEDITADLYPEQDEEKVGNPYSLDPDSKEDRLYGATEKVTLADETVEGLNGISEELEDSDAALLAENAAFMAYAAGADEAQTAGVVAGISDFNTNGLQQTQDEVMESITAEYGPDAEERLTDAVDLVASYPELHAYLHAGAGNHPGVVAHIIKIAQSTMGQKRIQNHRSNK